MLRTTLLVSSTCAALLVVGCSSDPAPATPEQQQTPGPGGTTTPAATAKQANRVTGSIKDERGNVITVPGATFEVIANGLMTSGEVHGITPPVAADGTFNAELVALGNYTVSAKIKVPWQGKTMILPLAPVGDNSVGQLSTNGVVQDFIWKLSGPYKRSANPDPDNIYDWYGGGVSFVRQTYRDDLGKGVPDPAEGTKWEFIFKPKQPKLIDGSDAKEKKIERTYKPYASVRATDVPLGVYDLTGIEIGTDGSRKPLVFQRASAPHVTTFTIDFPVGERDSPVYENLSFDVER